MFSKNFIKNRIVNIEESLMSIRDKIYDTSDSKKFKDIEYRLDTIEKQIYIS